MRFIKATPLLMIVLSGLVLLLSASAFRSAFAALGVPELPAALRPTDKEAKVVLLDFYASWCGTCKKMAPKVEELRREGGKKLQVIHLDVDNPVNASHVSLYGVDGTPTYYIFNANGKPLYKMSQYINSTVLEAQVMRALNKVRCAALPTNVPAVDKAAKAKPLMLLSFETAECKPCKQAKPYLNYLERRNQAKTSVVSLNTKDAGVGSLMKHLAVKQTPSYVLLDNQGRELYRMTGAINPQELVAFVNMFNEGEL